MRRLSFQLLICSSLVLPLASRVASASPDACALPDALTTTTRPLSRFGSAIAAGGPVSILALGSATTVGSANASGEPTSVAQGTSFPWHMLQTLQAALPKVTFQLMVRGGRGMTAADMLVPLQAALQEQHFALVLWQTGTVEAIRGMRLDGLRNALRTGTEQVLQGGGDVVLIDSQYSRMLSANTELDPYEGALQQVATTPGVALFQRYDLTRSWTNAGRIDLERTPKDDRDKALDTLNTCLGQALAKFALSGANTAKK